MMCCVDYQKLSYTYTDVLYMHYLKDVIHEVLHELSGICFFFYRKDWDLYLVPPSAGGSRIPEGWVVPPEPSSSVWASALRDRQTGW